MPATTRPRWGFRTDFDNLDSGWGIGAGGYNEVTRILDSTLHFRIKSFTAINAPPGSPANGDAHLVGSSPTGDFAGQAGRIAVRDSASSSWFFFSPVVGMVATADDNGHMLVWNGTAFALPANLAAGSGNAQFGSSSEIATTSGTAFDFNGLPAWVTAIDLLMFGVSLSGTDNFLVQIGPSSGVETTGYVSQTGNRFGEASSTSGFSLNGNGNANLADFNVALRCVSADRTRWLMTLSGAQGGFPFFGGGRKTLAGPLDRVRLTRTGANTFDAGSVRLLYWGA